MASRYFTPPLSPWQVPGRLDTSILPQPEARRALTPADWKTEKHNVRTMEEEFSFTVYENNTLRN